MFSNQQAEVPLNVPIRALDAVQADKVESRFLAGSCVLEHEEAQQQQASSKNQLHLLRFHSEANQLISEATLDHATGPVAQIRTSPTDKTMLLTLASQGTATSSSSATLWKIPNDIMDRVSSTYMDDYDDEDGNDEMTMSESATLEERATLCPQDGASGTASPLLVDLQWRGGADEGSSPHGDVLTLDQTGTLTQWDIAFGAATSTRTTTANVAAATWNLPPRMAWDPHNVDATAVSAGTDIHIVDWRTDTSVPAGTVSRVSCHRYGVTDLDYNPNKPYVLTTAGQDGLVKFWDLRSAKQPLMVLRGGHRHWVSRVSYNPFHDQLILSAGTDSLVNLWRISTISSAPLLTLDDDDDHNETGGASRMMMGAGEHAAKAASEPSGPNVRVSRLEHMDSVYATAWGAADAWIYASAGYDGKIVLNHVPSKEKYKILL